MQSDLGFYDDVEALERFIGIPNGSLRNIPIYARVPAVNAILAVREMEKKSMFRPGLYYIVLADLVGNTAFNAKYGDKAGDIRVEWFQTCAIQALGEVDPMNYAAYLKPIGDAALLIFSSFSHVVEWSGHFRDDLTSMSAEYVDLCDGEGDDFDKRILDFEMKARCLVHLGEVRFKEASDPICLAVSQAFKIEKAFTKEHLGCTASVLSAVKGVLPDLKLSAEPNVEVQLAGDPAPTLTYYLVPGPSSSPV